MTLQDHEIRREYPTAPLIGVGAVIVDEDCVVLVRRGKPPALGEWSIPGGLVWLGETLKEAVAREAHEETGIEVRVDALVELLERIFPDEHGRIRYHYVLADFSCRVVGGELKAGSDAMDAKWVRREDLVSFDLAPVTMKVVLKALDQQVAIHRMTNARS